MRRGSTVEVNVLFDDDSKYIQKKNYIITIKSNNKFLEQNHIKCNKLLQAIVYFKY